MQAWYLLYCKRGQLQRAQEHPGKAGGELPDAYDHPGKNGAR